MQPARPLAPARPGGSFPRMPRRWVWLQLIIGWLPVWALYGTLIVTAHPNTTLAQAAFSALRAIAVAALLGLLVQRLIDRLAWPHPLRAGFVAVHLVAAVAYAAAWMHLLVVVEHVAHGHGPFIAGVGAIPFLVLGVWFYIMVAGVSYASRATERAARAEAMAARSQLAALRSQLNPHFLFNALHTVVQLIPRAPRQAAEAAEQIAGVLRTTIEEDRDVVPLAEECAFVERYLDIERIRFGDRLQVKVEVTPDAAGASLPCFALQALVENAVRHGAAPREEPTTITVAGRVTADQLILSVHDTGAGASPEAMAGGSGTGLQRLRERLAVLYGARARLDLETGAQGGFTATLVIPRSPAEGGES
jgi:signal transduction histidine kinase